MGYVPLKPTVVNGLVVAAQNLAVTSTAKAFAVFNPNSQVVALQVLGGNVFCTLDGTTPSSSNGAELFLDQAYHWDIQTAQRAKFIEASSSAVVYAQECVTCLDTAQLPPMEIWKPAIG